jgi:hypothetical protein
MAVFGLGLLLAYSLGIIHLNNLSISLKQASWPTFISCSDEL